MPTSATLAPSGIKEATASNRGPSLLIKLKEGAGIQATVLDIEENPKNIEIKELEAAQIAKSINDVDFAVLNGNYAIEAGLDAPIAVEASDSLAADTYANYVCVREGDENSG